MKTINEASVGDIYEHHRFAHLTVLRVKGYGVSASITQMYEAVYSVTVWDDATDTMRATLVAVGSEFVATAMAISTLKVFGSVDGVVVRYES